MFEGVTTALITPFMENGEVDYEGYRKNVQFQIKEGMDGLLVLGTTGETPVLVDDEQEKLVKIAIKKGKGKVNIIVGTGTNNTARAVKNTKKAEELGADAALVVTPYYNKPSDEGLYQHFKRVADSVKIPIIVYNIQGRTGKNICTSLLERLSEIDNIVAVKEASGNINQMNEVIGAIANKKDFTVLSGDDGLTLPLMSLGGRGVISVISNAIPRQVKEFVDAGLSGNFAKARKLHHDIIMPMTRAAFIETNPIPIKHICTMMGQAGGSYRLPMCRMSIESRNKVDLALRELGLLG